MGRRGIIEVMNPQQSNTEQATRKEKSEAILALENVPFMAQLPAIESSNEVNIRSAQSVAFRAICLIIIAIKGEGTAQDLVDELILKHGADKYFTPAESAFIKNTNPSDQERNQFVWRYESALIMLWALGFIEQLSRPDQLVDVPELIGLIYDHSTGSFLGSAALRDASEILDQADLYYRYYWAVVDAHVNAKEAPAGLNGSVVYERLYALNWLTGYMNQEWDDVTTDT